MEGVGEPSVNFDQQKTLLISMLPASGTDCTLKSPAMTNDHDGSYDMLDAGLVEYLGLLDSQAKMLTGNVCAMADQRGEPPETNAEYEYTEPWWNEYYGKWMRSISEISAAAKRQRSEDGEDNAEAQAETHRGIAEELRAQLAMRDQEHGGT